MPVQQVPEHHHITSEQWDELAADPEFRALVRARRVFVVPMMLFVTVFYLALPIAAGFAPGIMSRPVLGSLTAAYLFALAQFPVGWLVLALYLRRSRGYDLTAARCRKHEMEEIRG
ncbi:MAG: DUF485 domain-containing protein [Candidatus Eremiobacteraeota bacterium]|nr:DUF485 domain-containing protein [Candidatus Eremiobacteraeota bacterium]MBV8433519.1 DUF485 domain-containing protein [Candidatus Eremiobacteraeota bacterium]